MVLILIQYVSPFLVLVQQLTLIEQPAKALVLIQVQ